MNATVSEPTYRVLLIGIDAYDLVRARLRGCVADIDDIEAVLLQRVKVPTAAITKLVARLPGTVAPPDRASESAPDLAAIRAAFADLASERTHAGDRVLIYYAGHGTQVASGSIMREALVPKDYVDQGSLLYDAEINQVIQKIAAITDDLTVILDCCNSAGATRSLDGESPSPVRFLAIEGAAPLDADLTRGAADDGARGVARSLDNPDPPYLVLAACQADETASEIAVSPTVHHGALTFSLLSLLGKVPDEELGALRWADLWQLLRAKLLECKTRQSPWAIGRRERRIFGGPFQPQDLGILVSKVADGYKVEAGSMTSVTEKAVVAVYGPTTNEFPEIDSDDDLKLCLGRIVITKADATSSLGVAKGVDFEIPRGARGRLIQPGEASKLLVALDPPDADLQEFLDAEGVFTVVPADDPRAEAFVGKGPGKELWIGDKVFGRSAAGQAGEPPLAVVPTGDRVILVRGLDHYARYNVALRLWSRRPDDNLSNRLKVTMLDCSDADKVAAADKQAPDLPSAPSDPEGHYTYRVRDGAEFAIKVENSSGRSLYAYLINCSTSGQVEILGSNVQIGAGKSQVFWYEGNFGSVFPASVPDGRTSGVERVIVVATIFKDIDLSFLEVTESFEEAMNIDGARSLLPKPSGTWTSTQITLKIERG